ncbi:glucosaminidase domain-containing protein, partial [Faecalitalea cylindroides]|uniref:glucosaminidase domain-containing protein n=1 Tax=Faecalitalea cylindroides TaxID=39483 RepID=UPI00194E3B12
VSIANHKYHAGEYKMDTYLTDGNGFTTLISGNHVMFAPKTLINGDSNITVSQMVNWFNDNNSNFDKFTKYSNGEYDGIYKKAGINSIEDFCQIYYEEATAEGIRVEVAFSQAMLETGFLTYGGQVKPSQFNFAGLGATDNGASGASFNSVREGIRAHIQHLKCYSSTDPLVNECVDPRWNESLRGKAIYVEYLSIPNNPYNVGWATDKNYSKKILNLMEMLISTNV